jgi:hypothetical protein
VYRLRIVSAMQASRPGQLPFHFEPAIIGDPPAIAETNHRRTANVPLIFEISNPSIR